MTRYTYGIGTPVITSILITIVLLSLPFTSSASATEPRQFSWARTLGENLTITSILPTSDGNYIIAGHTETFGVGLEYAWIVKLDMFGKILWQRAYATGAYNLPVSVRETSDGGYIVGGLTNVGGRDAGWVFKVDSLGNIVWQKVYRGTYATSLRQTSDRGFLLTGDVTFRLDPVGNILWQRQLGILLFDATQASDGGFLLISCGAGCGFGYTGPVAIKLDPMGNMVWQKSYGGVGRDKIYSVRSTSDGGFLIAGSSNSFSDGFNDAWVFKLDTSGNMVWQKTYGGRIPGAFSEAFSAEQALDGGFVVVGFTSGFGSGLNDGWIFKLDRMGNIEWQSTFGGPEFDSLGSVQQTNDGGYLVGGAYEHFKCCGEDTLQVADSLVLKLDSGGNVRNCRIEGQSDAVVAETSATVNSTSLIDNNASAVITPATVTVIPGPAVSKVLCFHG